MTISDPIADMLTRIRNAIMARHDFVLVPASRMKLSIARILREEGFISDYEVLKGKPHGAKGICSAERDHPGLWRLGHCHPVDTKGGNDRAEGLAPDYWW